MSQRTQLFQTGISTAQQASEMAPSFEKGKFAHDKGHADALNLVARAADQNLSTSVSQGVDQAATYDRAAGDINQARVNINSTIGHPVQYPDFSSSCPRSPDLGLFFF